MPLLKRRLADDAAEGKKASDFRARANVTTWRAPRRRRIVLGAIVVFLLYIFFKNLPGDALPASRRRDGRLGLLRHHDNIRPPPDNSPQGSPSEVSKPINEHYFEGPVKFYNLAATLGHGTGFFENSHNVLFAASSLNSVARIMPLACEMSMQNRSKVHFAMLGRDEISLEMLKHINGMDDTDCRVQWHDARPDHSPHSSGSRMEISVRAALGHIESATKPQAMLVDTAEREDEFFSKAIQEKSRHLGLTVIELPSGAIDKVRWVTRLSGTSLKAMKELEIDILVHAQPESSGSLIRLLKSLTSADYLGLPHPKLTIELPASTDPSLVRFLQTFCWPPDAEAPSDKLNLRRRIHPTRLTPTEASIRTVEAFFPPHTSTSHVLVLTAQAELSPSFYQYLLYTVLEYRYGDSGAAVRNLLGVSLDLPAVHLDGATPFQPPAAGSRSRSPVFLWQAPNSNAAVYFGDKWAEFHSFLTNRFAIEPESIKIGVSGKLVSRSYPAWVEYMLELVRARGYSMLYPSFAVNEGQAVVTIHSDLYQVPDENFEATTSDSIPGSDQLNVLPKAGDPLTAQAELARAGSATESSSAYASAILSLMFPDSSISTLPSLNDIQRLGFTGELLSWEQSEDLADSYAGEFASSKGGCRGGSKRTTAVALGTDDLFCLAG